MSTDPSQIMNEAIDLAPLAEVAVGVIAKIVQMVAQASAAKQEQHDAIVARLKAADDALAAAADDAHKTFDDEVAADTAAIQAATAETAAKVVP